VTVFWDVAPCNLVEVYRRFRDAYCSRHQAVIEAAVTSEMSVSFCKTEWRNIPEGIPLRTWHFENLKAQNLGEIWREIIRIWRKNT
jgi:hypothetical protein